MKNRGLAARLICFILPATAIIFLAAFAYNYLVSKEGIIHRASENARHLTKETVYRIETILHGVEKVPLNLAATLENVPCEGNELVSLMRTALIHNEELFGLGIAFEPYAYNPRLKYFMPYFCRNGDELKFSMLGGDSYQYFYQNWYQVPRELERPQWSEPYFDEGGGNIIMSTYAVPLYGEKEGRRKLAGMVGADISLKWLTDIVSAVKIYQTGFAFLISQNGVFVTHPKAEWIMRESVFSLAEAWNEPKARELGRDMIRGGEGFVPFYSRITGKNSWLYYAPLPSTGWSLALMIPEDELFADANSLMRRTVGIALFGLAFLALVITMISRGIARPLQNLALQTEAIAHGDFAATAPEAGAREIAHLARSFNRMGRELMDYIEKRDFIRDTFGRYVTQEVVKRLLESQEGLELGGETREVSILMSDLRGFTALTADMQPEAVITFLNRYLGRMIEILMEHRAVIDEIMGDGILAFFGAPEPLEDHPARAVACALAMQAAMEEINARNEADGLPHLEMGIAVNTGEVVVGNIGSERRTKYGVVGAHVNFASRIEAFALGGQVLISPHTYQRVQDLVEVRDTIQGQMKGVPGTITIYVVGGIGGLYNLHLQAKSRSLMPLAAPRPAHLYRLSDKVVTGGRLEARITQLGENAAFLTLQDEVGAWEDVRLHLLDDVGEELPGKIYGKVTAVQTAGDGGREVQVHFTSVSPEIYQIIKHTIGEVSSEQ